MVPRSAFFRPAYDGRKHTTREGFHVGRSLKISYGETQ